MQLRFFKVKTLLMPLMALHEGVIATLVVTLEVWEIKRARYVYNYQSKETTKMAMGIGNKEEKGGGGGEGVAVVL